MTSSRGTSPQGAEHDTDRLAACIAHKLRLLERLVELSRQQAASIAGDDMDGLLALLAVKQRLVEGLQQVERALDPYRLQSPDTRVWRSPSDREKCRASSDRCEELLRTLIASERDATGRLDERRERAETRLQGFDSVAKAQTAYAQSAPQSAHRLDLSSS